LWSATGRSTSSAANYVGTPLGQNVNRSAASAGGNAPLDDFTEIQKVEITASLANARKQVDERLDDMDLNNHRSQQLMNKWFFGNSQELRSDIRDKLVKMKNRLRKMAPNSFRPSGACMPGCAAGAMSKTAGAFVLDYGIDDPNVYLNAAAFDKDTWSLSRIMIHEVSHFSEIHAQDYAYGTERSLQLRTDAPRAAPRNADSISFFVTGGGK
jgi:hypothetical protein